MTDKMQKYVTLPREMPAKRPTNLRIQDHKEVYERVSQAEMERQASRCLQCGVPFCQHYCPVSNNIPDWLKATAEGRMKDAYDLSQATNNLPEICGRICPQDRLCEAKWACTLEQNGHGTVTIGAVEKHITETAWENGWVKPRIPNEERRESVGIVGAGPAGMAAAEELRALGYQVHLYDRYGQIGGLMLYGIPGFKLEKHIVKRRANLLIAAGIQFHPNQELGLDMQIEDLQNRHDSVVLAYGAYKARTLGIEGAHLPNVIPSLDFLVDNSRHQLGEITKAAFDTRGKRVIVIGGGDTAMDCLRTAVRQGAASVQCLYRRDKTNMPGSGREQNFAQEEGVDFNWQVAPEKFDLPDVEVINADNFVVRQPAALTVTAVRTRMAPLEGSDRMAPQAVPDSQFTLYADVIINALGFSVVDPSDYSKHRFDLSRRAAVAVNPNTLETAVTGVYAAGDTARGPDLVVWAINQGRKVSAAIHEKLAAPTL